MSSDFSFDIVSQVDLQEIDNAVNQTLKEIKTRFDFKGSRSEISFNREEKKILIMADDDMKLNNIIEILKTKLSKRGVSVKAVSYGTPEKAMDGLIRQSADILQGLSQDHAKDIVKCIKELKLKVQPSIQKDQVRVSARSKDDLQAVIQTLRTQPPVEIPLQFVNYR